ncbi:MAG: hypothetical protein EON59_03885 [Alphaproteobacteria bacterium]|nr:MAG: hypothetical protein EON59_03885 [Alphaproteobacteria bacterium]
MTTTQPSVAEVAKGLTKAQREVVIACDSPKPAFMLRADHDGRRAAYAIKTSRLFSRHMGGAQCLHYRLTPLGLAVRTFLQENPHAE